MSICSKWRARARAAIAAALAALPAGADGPAKRRALRAAYPFGPRQYHPYRVWCDEVRRALDPPPPASRLPEVRVGESGEVDCGWCGGAGCLACLHLRRADQAPEALRYLPEAESRPHRDPPPPPAPEEAP